MRHNKKEITKRGRRIEMKILKITLFSFLFLILIFSAAAVSIGVSPGKISFQGMMKGGYAERTITVSTNSDEDLVAHFEVKGEISEWLRFEPNNTVITLSKSQPYKLKIIAEPPADARNDSYSGSITIITDKFGDITGRAGGFVKAAVTLMAGIDVTNEEISKCSAGAFELRDVEIGYPLELLVSVENKGNVRIKPKVSIDIWDQAKDNLQMSKEVVLEEVLPTTSRQFFKTIAHNLEVGQYWANINIDECSAGELVTFSVFEKGGIADRGILKYITNKAWAFVGEPVQVSAPFQNIGGRVVYAKFKGNIKLDDKIVKLVETEEAEVPTGETRDFNFYFTPKQPGRYMITGRVEYNKKITFEKSSILNVNPSQVQEESKFERIIPLLIYLIIIITIIFLVRKIIKEQREKRKSF